MYMPWTQPTAAFYIHCSFLSCVVSATKMKLPPWVIRRSNHKPIIFVPFILAFPSLLHSLLLIHANYNEREMEKVKTLRVEQIFYFKSHSAVKAFVVVSRQAFINDFPHRLFAGIIMQQPRGGMNIYQSFNRLLCLSDTLINWFLESGNILAAMTLFISPAWQIELLSKRFV